MKIKQLCIIDDDPIYIFGIQRLMQASNICSDFVVYKNGQEAISEIKSKFENSNELPEVIFLDLNMPTMTGWEFLEEFTKIPDHTKTNLFIVSSSIDPFDVNRAENHSSVNQYLLKPVSREVLTDIFDG